MERLCYTKENGALISIIYNACINPAISYQYGCWEKDLQYWRNKNNRTTTCASLSVFFTFLKIKSEATIWRSPCLENIMLPTMLCGGSCASSPEILPWCTCDWVTWPELQHGARVPWLMFYKLPRGSCTNSVPIFPPCCMHSAWDYIPQLQLLRQTMNSRRDDSHLTNPRTPRKIQIKEGRMHCSDLLAPSVCVGCRLVEEEGRKKSSTDPVTRRVGLCV